MVGTEGRQYATRCHECRRRKVKCDGGKPACQRCIDHALECTGYSREHEFVFFDAEAKMKPDNEGESSKDRGQKSRSTTPSGSRSAPRPRAIAPQVEQPSVNSPFNMEFVEVLRDRCIPIVASTSNERAVCSLWISKICELYSRPDSPDMIRDAVSALSLAVSGTDLGQTKTWANGLQRYSLALNQLRVGLEEEPRSPDRIDAFLVTCLCCALYEMLVNRRIMSSLDHMNGLGALLERIGVESIMSETSRLTLYFFRVLMFPILLTTRLPIFLTTSSWLNPIWKHSEFHSSTHLQSLLDHALFIPSLMAQFDTIQQSFQQTGSSNPQDLSQLLQTTFELGKTIDNWHEGLNEGDNTSRLYIVRLSKSRNSQEASLATIFPISYTYPNFELATALVFYQMTRISLDLLLIDISTLLQQITPAPQTPDIQTLTANAVSCADKICQSTEYFFEPDKKVVGRMGVLPPFWVAMRLYERFWSAGVVVGVDGTGSIGLRERLGFCEAFKEVVIAAGLPVWGA